MLIEQESLILRTNATISLVQEVYIYIYIYVVIYFYIFQNFDKNMKKISSISYAGVSKWKRRSSTQEVVGGAPR